MASACGSRQGRVLVVVALVLGMIALPSVARGQSVAAGAKSSAAAWLGTAFAWGEDDHDELANGAAGALTAPGAVSLANVTAVSFGGHHLLFLDGDGHVWSAGYNSSEQLGLGANPVPPFPFDEPRLVPGLSGIVQIAAGALHSLALAGDGTVFAWGANGDGQLGDGTTTERSSPVAVFTGAASIAAGGFHSLAVGSDGTAWGWGQNGANQLGDGTSTDRNVPTPVAGLSGVVGVATGYYHSLFLRDDGSVYAVGYNQYGQRGPSTGFPTQPVLIPGVSDICQVAAGDQHSMARGCDGSVWAWGLNGRGELGDGTGATRSTPALVSSLPPVATLAAGPNASHSLAMTADGALFAWGWNLKGQLGDGTYEDRWSPVEIMAAGGTLKVATPAFSVASNTFGRPQTVAISTATSGATIHYTLDGSEPDQADSTIASGASLSVDVSQTIKARAWKTGMPPSNVGVATYTLAVNQPSASPPGTSYTSPQNVTLATTSPGAQIRYTLDGSTPTAASALYTAPVNLATTTTLKAVGFRSGWTPSTVRTATYTFNYGTLAAPTVTPPSGTYTSAAIVSMTTMAGATIRYTTNGNTPTTSSPAYTAPLAIEAGTTLKAKAFHPDYTPSAVTTAVYTIVVADPVFDPPPGLYLPGQQVLVTTSTPNATIRYTLNGADPTGTDPAVPASGLLTAGNFILKTRAFKTGAQTSNVVSGGYTVSGAVTAGRVAAGDAHSLVLRNDGVLWSWGSNTSGQLGDGTTTGRPIPGWVNGLTGAAHIAAGGTHNLAIDAGGALWAWGANGSGRLGDGTTTVQKLPVLIGGLSVLTAVAAGGDFSLALAADGTVSSWGANASGQLGIGTTTSRSSPGTVPSLASIAAIAAGTSHALALTTDGRVFAWGSNGSGQIGVGTTTSTYLSPTEITSLTGVVAIGAGANHSLAVLGDGRLFTWGLNSSGQLGDNTTTLRRSPIHVTTLSGVAEATGGSSHSVVRLATGAVYAMGLNTSGQIGDGTTTQRKLPALVSNVSNVVQIASRDDHTIALTGTGAVYTWGRNGNGQLGDNTTTNRTSPVALGTDNAQWVLAAPTVTPASGSYGGAQTVTIAHTVAGVLLRYTLDGTEPTPDSLAYTAAFSITHDVVVKAKAFKIGWTDSPTVTRTYTFSATDTTPPTITAQVTPAPNAAGWHNVSPTVTFTCNDTGAGIASCTPAKVVTTEGANLSVTGTAVDKAGNIATLPVLLKVDRTAPTVSVSSPADGDVLPSGTTDVTMRGGAMDATAGVSLLTCNGVTGTLAGQSYTCTVPLSAGPNSITVAVTDAAGHASQRQLTVTVGAAPAPQTVEISPASLTMVAGEVRRLQVTNERGAAVTTGTWTVDDPAVAEVTVTAGVTEVRALAAGDTTLTVTVGALTAESELTVLAAGAEIPVGTTLWSLAPNPESTGEIPPRAHVIRPLWQDLPPEIEQPGLFFIDEGVAGWDPNAWSGSGWYRPNDRPTVITATTHDGRRLWQQRFGGPTVRQFAADEYGGLVTLVEWHYPSATTYAPHVLRRYGGVTGAITWEHHAAWDVNNASRVTSFAIAADGRVYAAERTPSQAWDLFALDGQTGSEVGRWSVVSGAQAAATGPLILEDGTVVLFTTMKVGATRELRRVVLGATGLTTTLVDTTALASAQTANLDVSVFRAIPDGQGGLLLTPNELIRSGNLQVASLPRVLYRVDQVGVLLPLSLVPSTGPSDGVYRTDVVLGDDAAWVFVEGVNSSGYYAKTLSFDPVTLAPETENTLASAGAARWDLRVRSAVGGGGVYLSGPASAYAVGVSESIAGFAAGGNAWHIGGDAWAGWGPGVSLALGDGPATPSTIFAESEQGGTNRAANARYGIWAKGHRVLPLSIFPSPYFHVSIHVVPHKQFEWNRDLPLTFNNPLNDGSASPHWFATLGAGAGGDDTSAFCGGKLVAAWNRPNDVNQFKVAEMNLKIPRELEDLVITRLLEAETSFNDTEFDYDCWPETSPGYNSNSFARGLLRSRDMPQPSFPRYGYPGWHKPVPSVKFFPPQ